MIIRIESTSKVVTLDGVRARLWEGHTESGIPVIVWVTRIAVPEGAPQEQFQTELEAQRAPSAEAEALPMWTVL